MNQSSYPILILLLVLGCMRLNGQGHSTKLDIDNPQTRIMWDSLVAFNEAYQYYEAIPLLQRITKQAEQVGELEALAYAYDNLAELLQMKEKLEESQEYGLLAAKYFKELKNWDQYVLRMIRASGNRTGRGDFDSCLLYTSPSPRDATLSRMPSSA